MDKNVHTIGTLTSSVDEIKTLTETNSSQIKIVADKSKINLVSARKPAVRSFSWRGNDYSWPAGPYETFKPLTDSDKFTGSAPSISNTNEVKALRDLHFGNGKLPSEVPSSHHIDKYVSWYENYTAKVNAIAAGLVHNPTKDWYNLNVFALNNNMHNDVLSAEFYAARRMFKLTDLEADALPIEWRDQILLDWIWHTGSKHKVNNKLITGDNWIDCIKKFDYDSTNASFSHLALLRDKIVKILHTNGLGSKLESTIDNKENLKHIITVLAKYEREQVWKLFIDEAEKEGSNLYIWMLLLINCGIFMRSNISTISLDNTNSHLKLSKILLHLNLLLLKLLQINM